MYKQCACVCIHDSFGVVCSVRKIACAAHIQIVSLRKRHDQLQIAEKEKWHSRGANRLLYKRRRRTRFANIAHNHNDDDDDDNVTLTICFLFIRSLAPSPFCRAHFVPADTSYFDSSIIRYIRFRRERDTTYRFKVHTRHAVSHTQLKLRETKQTVSSEQVHFLARIS